ncbi:MAG: hypothetical protein IKC01_00350 [Clostridia bacterium]|nr:hypothetical protein [Clostridia bacterium]
MTYIYVATRIITYFGTELRTFWEHLVCRFFKIPVEDARAFKSSEMCGHIEHELTKSVEEAFVMCFFPFIMNLLLGICVLLTGAYRVIYIGEISVSSCIFLWVGISLLANCAPSFEDVLSFKDALYNDKTKGVVRVLLTPHFAVSYACAFLERYSLTFVLSVAFAFAFPTVFSLLFPVLEKLIIK